MSSIIGVDLGGTRLRVTRYDAVSFEIQAEERRPTKAAEEFSRVFEDMVELLTELRAKDTEGIGVGVPGLVRYPQGEVLTMPNIRGAENFALQKALQKRFDLPVSVENDGNCFALAEALHGAGKGHKVVVGITMGTGVGGGIVIDSKLYRGSNGYAGEIGHMLLRPGEPPYPSDDTRGDVEQFLSGSARGKRCQAAKTPEEYLESEVCSFLRPDLFREAAWMCASLTHLLDPSIIIFGGGAGTALKPYLSEIEKELASWVLPGTPLPSLAIATLKDAGTRGAALLLRE